MQRNDDKCEPGPMEEEVTATEGARLTGYSVAHVRWLAAQGKVRARKLGRRMWLVDSGSLLEHKARMSGPQRVNAGGLAGTRQGYRPRLLYHRSRKGNPT